MRILQIKHGANRRSPPSGLCCFATSSGPGTTWREPMDRARYTLLEFLLIETSRSSDFSASSWVRTLVPQTLRADASGSQDTSLD